jgi:HEAT repeat protein
MMDANLRKIAGMLQSPDGMRRCAAAMVLTELAPKDNQVVDALGGALKDANQLLTRYVLEAFEAIGTRAVVPHVLPLLNIEDIETKLRAMNIVASAGGDVVPEIQRQFTQANPQQRRVLVDVLARIHTRDAMNIILDVFFDPDFELVKEACQAIRRHMTGATPQERVAMHKLVVKFMTSSKVRKHDRALTSSLLVIGYIGAPDARKILLKYSTPKTLGYIRRNALIGLKGLTYTGAAANAIVREMMKYLDESDPVIVQHALDIVDRVPVTGSFDAQYRKLLKSKHAVVRSFAVRRLASTDNPATNQLMLTLLAHEDAHVSEIAAGALARHRHATPLLLAALAKERNAEAAWRLAKILKPHSEAVDKKTIKKFVALATRDLEAGNHRYEALVYFLRNIHPATGDTVLRDAGLKFKKLKKWTKAIECLRQLARAEGFDSDLRYELSVCGLKHSPKDLAPHLRMEDQSVRGFQALIPDKAFKLFDRLKQEKAFEAADLYYLGFHFTEGVGEEQRLGQQLLEYVVKRWPKSKEGKAAKNKLKLTPSAPTAA